MKQTFFKYQGTGNDFIMIENLSGIFPSQDSQLIRRLCDRRFGIGADGLILIENRDTYDFKMIYFNADGSEGSMCGNGARCAVAFAKQLGLISKKTTFEAVDGLHYAEIQGEQLQVKMNDVSQIDIYENYAFTDTGSPHHLVLLEEDLESFDVESKGRLIAHGSPYFQKGSNVNFIKKVSNAVFQIRTYERGVEAETLSCGTGATAVAVTMHKMGQTPLNDITILVRGGELNVSFSYKNKKYQDIFLKGKATCVFSGEVEI